MDTHCYWPTDQIGGSSSWSFGTFLKHMNQSRHVTPSSLPCTRSSAVPHDPAGGTITSSPGCQSAGVATFILSLVCSATTNRRISGMLRPLLRG
jgi:hypothetical protein